MMFDEFLKEKYPFLYADKDKRGIDNWVKFAEDCWNFAKKDCGLKPAYIVEPYETESHKEVCWTVYGKEEGMVLFYCQSKERCVEWCLQNYYCVVEQRG